MASLKSSSVRRASVTTSKDLSHIITDVLYPSYVASGTSNKLLDGTTSHSGAFGTVQSDDRMYYYTNINGSKPIKDPRIGAYFGSQRYKTRSLQLLEQETATHGANVYTVDGREWMRAYGTLIVMNNDDGIRVKVDGADTSEHGHFEIVGYFSDLNIMRRVVAGSNQGFVYSIDGAAYSAEQTGFEDAQVNSIFRSRYVDSSNLLNVVSGQTLGIHTINIRSNATSDYGEYHNFELIAQDTTSTATKSQIQIPSQNVVSFGKNFTVAGTPHYDPFNGFTNSTDSHTTYVDTATSLGLSSAPGSSKAWDDGASSTTTHIRPYNGGRVVKWVDSAGVIKTSVNMMPPNAQNVLGTVIGTTEVTTPSATNATPTPIFSDDAIDHSQAEIAKTFNIREFGNGSANLGSGSTTYMDVSMIGASGDLNLSYCMDDGLTSFAGQGIDGGQAMTGSALGRGGVMPQNQDGDFIFLTFIGTGLAQHAFTWTPGMHNIVQNLPYGTHTLKMQRNAISPTITIDGISMGAVSNSLVGGYGNYTEVSFYQPKMPPIPEDAVVIADYMLMADYVPQTSGTPPFISKGVRRNNASRDIYYDTSASSLYFGAGQYLHAGGFQVGVSGSQSADVFYGALPSFATRMDSGGYGDRRQIYVDSGSAETQTVGSGSTYDAVAKMTNPQTLGLHTFKAKNKVSTDGTCSFFDVAIPIHTSSHYQAFETSFQQELVGGDRNMEQTNLVVTPDGKTWDEVTRDTSYIGKQVVHADFTGTATASGAFVYWDDHRGTTGTNTSNPWYNKDFAICYGGFLCLVPGSYSITARSMSSSAGSAAAYAVIWVRGAATIGGHTGSSGHTTVTPKLVTDLKRGDFVQVKGHYRAELNRSSFFIERN